jgi:hypothetical protein
MAAAEINRGAAMLACAKGGVVRCRARRRFALADRAHFWQFGRNVPAALANRTRSVFAARSAVGWDATIVDTLRT